MPPNSDAIVADVALVGPRRRVDRRQHDVVAAREQLRGQRVVAQAAPAVHLPGAAGERQNPHRVPRGDGSTTIGTSVVNFASFAFFAMVSVTATPRRTSGGLERPGAEQELDDVAFVRLEPVELNRRHRTEVQAIDVHRVDQRAAQLRLAGDRVQTSVGPIASSIFASGHSTTVTNGNMYSFFAIAASGDVAVHDGRQQVVGAARP